MRIQKNQNKYQKAKDKVRKVIKRHKRKEFKDVIQDAGEFIKGLYRIAK